ncbi:MAG: hypothetical protein GXY61_01405 [Lentisphaerae bacterium]|jgi:hypothetical protein|nr:hypothetical protein [Lentisphaerota bacterium]
MINFSQLTKEQKQYVFLGVVALAIFVWLGVLGAKEVLSSMTSIDTELAEVDGKLKDGLRKEAEYKQVSQDYLPTVQQTMKYLVQDIPNRNRLTEIQTKIYLLEKNTELTVFDIKEIPLAPGGSAGGGAITLNSYALQISAKASYVGVLQFVAALYKEFPLVRVVYLNIRSQTQEPEQHLVEIQVQWLCDFHSFLEKWEGIDALSTSQDAESDAALTDD